MTEFQRRIMQCLNTRINGMADLWEIAQVAFPEKWTKKEGRARSGRGALVANMRRACSKLDDDGFLVMWISNHQSHMVGLPHGMEWDDEKQELRKRSDVSLR